MNERIKLKDEYLVAKTKENRELESLNQQIEGLFQQWKDLQPMKPEDQERFDRKVRLDWNYHSNKIEGNTLTYGQTELLLIFGRHEGGHLGRDYLEMQAHDVGIKKVIELAKDKEHDLTELDIRDLNKIILKEPFWSKSESPDGKPTRKQIIPGEYKKSPNHVKTVTGEIFRFAEPYDVPPKMQDLMDWLRKEIKNPTLPIALFLAQLHHRFILIHPFDDGNGRIVRLLVNYILLKLGYPPLVVRSNDRENYLIAINKADVGDMDALAIYLGKVLVEWLEIGIKASRGEDISDPSDVDKEVDLFVREQESKGLHKYFSEESASQLIDYLLEVLFKTFKDKFRIFNKIFNSKEIKQLIIKDGNQRNLDIMGLQWYLSSQNSWCGLKACIELFYKAYRGKYIKSLKKPFDMRVVLYIEINEFQYKMSIKSFTYFDSKINEESQISEKRYYNQLFTQEEANKFISKGKEEFLKLLKKAIDENKGDEKQNTKPESTSNQEKNK